MKRIATTCILLAVAPFLSFAKNYSGFGLDAFNRSVSAATRANAAFSPISFEIDSVIFSEAFGALTRAKFAETMGVLNGLESAYLPLHERLSKTEERGLSFLHARAFCVPNEYKAHPAYRKWMQTTFSAEMFSIAFRQGADCWFRSRLDGEMERFEIPDGSASSSQYSYFDLVSFRCQWKDAFQTNNTRVILFHRDDGTSTTLPAMCDLRAADMWEKKDYAVLRIPMADSSWFYALLPQKGKTVRDIRTALSSTTIVNLVVGIRSVTESGVSHGNFAIAIPKIDIISESDLKSPFHYFQFPLSGMERMEKDISPKYIRQIVRFQLDETGIDCKSDVNCVEAPNVEQGQAAATRFILNKPFLFFIIHEPTSTIPIVGQFTGK